MFVEDLGSLITGASLAVVNQSLFFGAKPAIPASVIRSINITETGGMPPEYVQNQVLPAYVYTSAQILIREGDARSARVFATSVYNLVCAVRNQLIGSVWYLWIRPLQEPFDFGLDERERARVVFNVLALKRPS